MVQSLLLIAPSGVQQKTKAAKRVDVPNNWIEFYSLFDKRWISLDCVRGLIDEKLKFEDKHTVHSFVLACDNYGSLWDLTEKYSSDYEGKTYKLRKDEDKWLKEFILAHNSKVPMRSLSMLEDVDAINLDKVEARLSEIPKTLSALKNSPTYIIPSQIRKYEVLYPKSEPIGYVNGEPIYLRANVQKVRSKEAWFSQFALVIRVMVNQVICFTCLGWRNSSKAS